MTHRSTQKIKEIRNFCTAVVKSDCENVEFYGTQILKLNETYLTESLAVFLFSESFRVKNQM